MRPLGTDRRSAAPQRSFIKIEVPGPPPSLRRFCAAEGRPPCGAAGPPRGEWRGARFGLPACPLPKGLPTGGHDLWVSRSLGFIFFQ